MKAIISCREPVTAPNFDLAAMYWRGACLDVFSKAEKTVSDCIEDLRAKSYKLGEESVHPGAAARLRSLLAVLHNHSFAGHQRVAQKILHEWQELSLHRPYLAHGIFEIGEDEVVILLSEYVKGGRSDHPPRRYSRGDMRDLLSDLEMGANRISSQLAQIRAFGRAEAA
ncbi:hypothetical protein GRI34_10695 [Erythrobacter aquimaris]|uniref:Uncharacterized protein n=1 Tax=Qipengyuania aquimaris TaxID=255984 RepID=A0A6I4TLQ2_9SPHN|nr:hypothetical protein [Qipengyuania aquimaris]MXO96882.1 hypothetical protein [Qipengyuania aquimaris]